jgi:hypothetical protein
MMFLKKKRGLELDIGGFCGTMDWYRWSSTFKNFLLTDGTRYVAKEYDAYWLMDAIASYHGKLKRHEFQVWKLTVDQDKSSAVLTATNGNEKEIARQEIQYTDFPDDITLYCIDNGDGFWVILLTTEY